MQHTLLHYLHVHGDVLGDSESTAFHRLLGSACERVLAPLALHAHQSCDNSSEHDAPVMTEAQSVMDEPTGTLWGAQVCDIASVSHGCAWTCPGHEWWQQGGHD